MAKDGLGFEITELRLGLPGGGVDGGCNEKKRVYSEITRKGQVVGWPPVCSYRRKNSFGEKDLNGDSKMYVKVRMDGAPFLRKIDLNLHKGYKNLAVGLEKLFGSYGGKGLKEADSREYISIYEDKDGDWMLVGDVPWEMFVGSCKRLRIMKKSETNSCDEAKKVYVEEIQKIHD